MVQTTWLAWGKPAQPFLSSPLATAMVRCWLQQLIRVGDFSQSRWELQTFLNHLFWSRCQAATGNLLVSGKMALYGNYDRKRETKLILLMQGASQYFCERTAQYLSASEIGLCDVYTVWTVGVGMVSAKDLSTGDGVTSVNLGDDCTTQHCNLLSVNSAYKKMYTDTERKKSVG